MTKPPLVGGGDDGAVTAVSVADPTHNTVHTCRCDIARCDKPNPSECQVHGELHRLLCEPAP
jgi:hypothetical protein